eukprot:GDKI01015883.1.p1 GENE.GDKI01015883.1~~GDKI01015883.1.p1  ORF type:complete len:509 (+),score=135.47 GDKI01015883.1:160-1686(+)
MSSNKLLVMKFGGSSVKNAERIRVVGEILQDKIQKGKRPVLVLSAMGKTTNHLIQAGERALKDGEVDLSEIRNTHTQALIDLGVCTRTQIEAHTRTPLSRPARSRTQSVSENLEGGKNIEKSEGGGVRVLDDIDSLLDELQGLLNGIRLIREISPKTQDLLMSFGERMCVRIVGGYLREVLGVKSRAYDAWELGMRTSIGSGSQQHDKGSAEVLPEAFDEIARRLGPLGGDYTHTPVITGFIAKDVNGTITTLGRGGSDFSAAIFGSAVDAEEIEIWTDVNGVLTCDPRLVPAALCLPTITFAEAAELAYFGAKVLHPMTIQPAMQKHICVRVLNSYNPSHPGTAIVAESGERPAAPSQLVTALTYKQGVMLVDISSTRMLGQHGFLARVFEVFGYHNISVDVIATSEVSVSLTVDKGTSMESLQAAKEKLSKIATVSIEQSKSIVTLVGNTKRSAEILCIACGVFQKLDVPIEMVSCGASKINISFVVPDNRAEECVKEMHTLFYNC